MKTKRFATNRPCGTTNTLKPHFQPHCVVGVAVLLDEEHQQR